MTKWCPKCRKEVEVEIEIETAWYGQKIIVYKCPLCNQFLGSEVEDLRDRDEHGFDKSS